MENAPVNATRVPAMDAVGHAARGVVMQTGPEPSRAERFLAASPPHPGALEVAK